MRIHNFIANTIEARAAPDKLLTFPLQCGLGKSSYIRAMIQEHLLTNDGLIVVTDSLAGLKSLAGLPPSDKTFMDYLRELDEEQREIVIYLNANRDRIAYLDTETVKIELPRLYGRRGKPIILMSTQRYFSYGREDIIKLTASRPLIVFDEKPYITEQRRISIEQVNAIDAALKLAIDNTAETNNKAYLIHEWDKISADINYWFNSYEIDTPAGETKTFWHELTQTTNDRFLHLINDTYRAEIDKYSFLHNVDIRRDIGAVFQMLTEGATFTISKRTSRKSKDGSKYEKYFTVVIDNNDKLINVGANVVVFDGTADIHPDYDLDYIEMVDCSQYKRKLNNLSINIIDCNTSKSKLTSDHYNNGGKLLQTIIDDVHARYGNPVVFCHMERAKELSKHFSRVNYFGNIKGRNEYRDANSIVQIGANRYPDYVYQLIALHNELFSSAPVKRTLIVGKGWIEKKTAKVRNRMILADIEQNLFRGAIRDINCKRNMVYSIYISAYEGHEESQLIQMIRARFETLGVKIQVYEEPELKVMSRKGNTNVQKVLSWISSQPSGLVFKTKDILSATGLTNTEFQRARRSEILELKLTQMRLPGMTGYYSIL